MIYQVIKGKAQIRSGCDQQFAFSRGAIGRLVGDRIGAEQNVGAQKQATTKCHRGHSNSRPKGTAIAVYSFAENSASANCFASKGCRSSGCSPRPTNLIGRPNSLKIEMTIPALLVPSSLV